MTDLFVFLSTLLLFAIFPLFLPSVIFLVFIFSPLLAHHYISLSSVVAVGSPLGIFDLSQSPFKSYTSSATRALAAVELHGPSPASICCVLLCF